MITRCATIAILVALAACGSSSALTSHGAAVPPSCAGNARTLIADRQAIVYRRGSTVYGCSTRTGRSYRLGSTAFCNSSDRIGPIVLAGATAAYGVERCGVDTGTARVVVRRLIDGAVLHSASATTRVPGPESYESVGSLVVKADGAVGWIGAAHSIIGRGKFVEVHRLDRHGSAQLDQGAGITPTSLRLRRSQMTWLHSGSSRSAQLD